MANLDIATKVNGEVRIDAHKVSMIFENAFDICRDENEVEATYEVIKTFLDLECEARLDTLKYE